MEKLNIDPDKIIPILLKHLMDMKNEIGYLKHFILLHAPAEAVAKLNIGIKNDDLGSGRNNVGINTDDLGSGKINVGTNTDDLGSGKINVGTNTDDSGGGKINAGTNTDDLGTGKINVGINTVDLCIPKTNVGTNNDDFGTFINNIGIKFILEALAKSVADGNANERLYPIFEKALLYALDQYINNDGRQNSLYTFYSDFQNAVEEQNRVAERIEATANRRPVEETHSLPVQLEYDEATVSKLEAVVSQSFSVHARKDMCRNIASELLFIYNSGKATRKQLRSFTELSVPGFAKHFPKMIHNGFIKRLPPTHYELTDKSKHILLELFGVKKTD